MKVVLKSTGMSYQNAILGFNFFSVTGEFKLHIPDLDLEGEVEGIFSSSVMVEKLEQCVMNWQTQITIFLEEQKRKKPQVCFKPERHKGISSLN